MALVEEGDSIAVAACCGFFERFKNEPSLKITCFRCKTSEKFINNNERVFITYKHSLNMDFYCFMFFLSFWIKKNIKYKVACSRYY